MVYNRFSYDQHGLKQEDVKRSDCQNWGFAQRLCQEKVRTCLQEMWSEGSVHQERTLGTEKYLETCANYVSVFCSPHLDLRSRLVLASKVSIFFRFWKLWFSHGDHGVMGNSRSLSAKDNFMSQQCFVDIQMSCHFVVLLVCHFRD